jgi:chromosome segregation ATPase
MSQEFLTPEAQLENQLKAVASLQSEKAELQTSFENLASEKIAISCDLTAKVEEANAKGTALEAELASVQAEKAELSKQLEAALANQITASKEAAKVVASLGVKPVAVSPGDEAQAVDPMTIRQDFLKMTPGLDKQAFFKKHQAILTATK